MTIAEYLYGAEAKVAIYGTGILKSQGTLGGVLAKEWWNDYHVINVNDG